MELQVDPPTRVDVGKSCPVDRTGTLGIRGGGALRFAPNVGIQSQGLLEILGTSPHALSFERLEPEEPWDGIVLDESGADHSKIVNSDFRGGWGRLGDFPDIRYSTSPSTYKIR